MTRNGLDSQDTYEIFLEIDELTKSCKLTSLASWTIYKGKFSSKDGLVHGIGYGEHSDAGQVWSTFYGGAPHGMLISDSPTDRVIVEMRFG